MARRPEMERRNALDDLLEKLDSLSKDQLAIILHAVKVKLDEPGACGLTISENAALVSGNLEGCIRMIRERTWMSQKEARAIVNQARSMARVK